MIKNLRRSKGFILLEAVVGMLITAIVLIGILKLFGTVRALTVITKHKVQAISILQARIEQLKALDYDDLVVGSYPQNEKVVIDDGGLPSADDDLIGMLTTSVVAITDGKRITITITWTDFYGDITEMLETAVYSPT